MISMRYLALAKVLAVGVAAGLAAMWLLAFELAALQGVYSVGQLLRMPFDPDFRRLAVVTVLSPALMSPVWYWTEGRHLVAPRRVTLRWYIRAVAWGLASAGAGIFVLPYVFSPSDLISFIPGLFFGSVFGLAFGLPIVLMLSPITVRVAENIILREQAGQPPQAGIS